MHVRSFLLLCQCHGSWAHGNRPLTVHRLFLSHLSLGCGLWISNTLSFHFNHTNTAINRLNYAALSFSNSSHSDSLRGERPTDSRADYRSQSDSSENFVTGATEATFVCMTPTGNNISHSQYECKIDLMKLVRISYFSFSLLCSGEDGFLMSNNSAQQPDWRSNYKGDYKGFVNPISTRDLLCYAFQVARGMEYLASRKVRKLSLCQICFTSIDEGDLIMKLLQSGSPWRFSSKEHLTC